MSVEQAARELVETIWGKGFSEKNHMRHVVALITQALKRYGNGRLEEAAELIQVECQCGESGCIPTAKSKAIRNLKEPENG